MVPARRCREVPQSGATRRGEMILKVQRKDYEDAANKIERASKDYAAAVARVAATNKKFQYSALGAWAIAQAEYAGGLELELRAVESGLENLSKNMKGVMPDINGLFSGRDDVFSVVGASANNVDTAAFQSGGAAGKDLSAQHGVQDVKSKARAIFDACEGLEDSSEITNNLKDLQEECTVVNNNLIDLLACFNNYSNLVIDLNSESGLFGADKFVNDDMISQAQSATYDNIGTYGHIKGGIKLYKNILSGFGEIMKGTGFRAWKTDKMTFLQEANKKFAESTQGIRPVGEFATYMKSNVGSLISRVRTGEKMTYTSYFKLMGNDFLKQHAKNWDEIKKGAKEFDSYLTRKADIAAIARENKLNTAATKNMLDSAVNPKQLETMGKGLKAGARYLGYAGDVLTGIDAVKDSWDKGFSKGDWKQGVGQIAKGVAKIGAGKIIGAAIGSFGGPAGVVVGMAVGAAVGSLVDKGIDWAFSAWWGVN